MNIGLGEAMALGSAASWAFGVILARQIGPAIRSQAGRAAFARARGKEAGGSGRPSTTEQ